MYNHDTIDKPTVEVIFEFGFVVCYIGTLFGRVHGDLDFIFNFEIFFFFFFLLGTESIISICQR